MDVLNWLVGGAAIVGVTLMLLGGTRRAYRLRRQDPLGELQREQRQTQQSLPGIARETELRLYDFGRSIEARIENQLEILDQLIVEADREIVRLEGLLAESRFDWPADRVLSRTEQQRCFALFEAGFTLEETARCLNTSPDAVQAALDEWRRPERDAA